VLEGEIDTRRVRSHRRTGRANELQRFDTFVAELQLHGPDTRIRHSVELIDFGTAAFNFDLLLEREHVCVELHRPVYVGRHYHQAEAEGVHLCGEERRQY
jgi:hypothetical protein